MSRMVLTAQTRDRNGRAANGKAMDSSHLEIHQTSAMNRAVQTCIKQATEIIASENHLDAILRSRNVSRICEAPLR